MYPRPVDSCERFARHAWALWFLSACAPLPSELEREGPCGPERELPPGVVVAAASDEFTGCASCEPRCFRASDTLRSWDVVERGSNGLVFDPVSGGGVNAREPRPCAEPPCPLEYGYSTGATWTRVYEAVAADRLSRCDAFGDIPLWTVSWDAAIPTGTEIVLELRGGRTWLELSTATPVSVRLSALDAPSLHLTSVLLEAGLLGPQLTPQVLEVRAILQASADRRATPTLRSLSMELLCAPPD